VDHHDGCWGEGGEGLDGDVAQVADADDHRGGAGGKAAARPFDGVVGGQPGVGERGDVGGLQRRVEFDADARRS